MIWNRLSCDNGFPLDSLWFWLTEFYYCFYMRNVIALFHTPHISTPGSTVRALDCFDFGLHYFFCCFFSPHRANSRCDFICDHPARRKFSLWLSSPDVTFCDDFVIQSQILSSVYACVRVCVCPFPRALRTQDAPMLQVCFGNRKVITAAAEPTDISITCDSRLFLPSPMLQGKQLCIWTPSPERREWSGCHSGFVY